MTDDIIKHKEKELELLKVQQSQKNWENHIEKCKIFLDSIVGKNILKHTGNGFF